MGRRPSCHQLSGFATPEALLTVEKGEGTPVGVCANPELPVSWGTGVTQRRVAVDVEGVRSMVGTVLEPVGVQA